VTDCAPQTKVLAVLILCCICMLTVASKYPKSLPCDVIEERNKSRVMVDCTERGLTHVPKEIPRKATNLTLTINHIPRVQPNSFQGLENLTEIDMRCNCVPIKIGPKDRVCSQSVTIENGTFWELKKLKALYLDGNQLSSIPRGLPPSLSLLSLEVNHIHSIFKENLSELTSIEVLYFGQNCYYRNPCNRSYHIEDGAFFHLKKLTLLSLKSNNLSYIPHNLPSTLKELYLYNNNIHIVTEKDFQNLTQLEILDLSGNCPRCQNAPFPCDPCPNFSSLNIDQYAFRSLRKLKILRLHSNSLQSVPSQWFEGIDGLEVLDLSSNFLAKHIAVATFPTNLLSLQELDLSFNYEMMKYPNSLSLSKAFSNLKSLKVFRIKGFVFQELKREDLDPLFDLQHLEIIDLGTNFIKIANLNILSELKSFHIINLSDNKISSPSSASDGEHVAVAVSSMLSQVSPMVKTPLYYNGEVREIHYFRYDEYARSCKYREKEAGLLNPFTKKQCGKFGKTLDISRNNIFYLDPKFLNLSELRCLNLSGNAMSQTLNGSEFIYLTNLQYLDFSYNRLDLLYSTAFQELRNLVVLDISYNYHYFDSEGVTHMLNFTKNLPKLRILLMNHNKISTSTNTEMVSHSLERLEFKGNRLDMLWRDGDIRYVNIFRNLTSLKNLDISSNNLNFIPKEVFSGLPELLSEFYLRNNKLKSFSWKLLNNLSNLKVLDLSGNMIKTVPDELSSCTKTLVKLILRRNEISTLSQHFLKGAFSLKYLDLSFNQIQYIAQSTFGDDTVSNLSVLLLHGNKFMCTCKAISFVMWVNHTTVNIPRLATDVTCAAPGTQAGQSIIFLDLQACQHNSLSIILYILLTSLVLGLLTLSISSHLFLWDVWYIYHFCIAKLNGYKRLSSQSAIYDAFIVYDIKDPAVSDWVLHELRVHLEERGQPCLQLCLEERDWMPGCPLIESLSQSIQQSTRTAFVLTNKFLQSGTFKTAFYLAHQRLLDEKADVIIIIFLEKPSRYSKYLRLRKRLYRNVSLLEPVRYSWIPRTNPCDITAKNGSIVFHCEKRGLQEVPVGITDNATELQLEENKITNISKKAFCGLSKLKTLNLNWVNKHEEVSIAEGAFFNLTGLQALKLDGNWLEDVPAKLPPGLKVLYLQNNRIRSIRKESFSAVENITQIYLTKNCYYWMPCNRTFQIDNDSFLALTHLQVLSLSYNNLTHVPKRLPHSIESLFLDSNKIQQIAEEDFEGLTNLRILDLQGNCPRCNNAPYPCTPCPNKSIKIHPRTFTKLVRLEQLHLAGNSLSVLNSCWFETLTNLKSLFLSFNFLMDAIADGSFLSHLPHLEKLDLSYNYALQKYPETLNLSSSFSKLVSLKYLHIEGYVFKEIKSFTLAPLYNLTNLTVLNLGTNFIVNAKPSVFEKFPHLKLIYLSENRLYPVPKNGELTQWTGSHSLSRVHIPMSKQAPVMYQSTTGDFDFSIGHFLVKRKCFNEGRVLDLSSNNIFFISPHQFEGFGNISCLNLSNNGFASALNGTDFKALPYLKYLDLSSNKIDLAYDNAFKELKHLEVLDLSYNSHYFRVSGVTHNLNFLPNLPELKVLNLSHNDIFTLTSKTMNSTSLRELMFQNNNLKKLWKDKDHTYFEIFRYLVNLTHLDISYNEIEKIPLMVYKNLPQSLVKLSISHNALRTFEWNELTLFQNLQVLDLSHNFLTYVHGNFSAITHSLTVLKLCNNKIAQLSDGFLKDAKSLTTLNLGSNKLSIINQSTFQSGSENYLEKLFLQNNPFRCTCDIFEFILWLNKNDVDIPYLATEVLCKIPQELKGKGVIHFDIEQCVNNSVAFLIYFFTASYVVCFTVIAIMTHLFYWDASYMLHYWRAKLKGYHHLKSQENIYDAFVTYDTKDPLVSDWVHNHLRVQLEECGESALPICLEERDWTPGTAFIDSLSQSIRQSRKTVFVLTEAYVQSGIFKMAVYLAHQRLLDDNIDVIVLLLLEPVLQHSLFLRLRKRLCGRSVLEWPKNPSAEHWFWQSLRNTIIMDNQAMYTKLYARYFITK
ncbi:toll-like receptor 7-like, partial [Scleropages formosus]